jgi:hypothetical protein
MQNPESRILEESLNLIDETADAGLKWKKAQLRNLAGSGSGSS